MIKLTKTLIRLFEEEKSIIVEFEELASMLRCTNNDICNIIKKLQLLAQAELIKFSLTDIWFRIEISNMKELQDIHKVLVAIESTDDDTRGLLNQVAFEIKGRTKSEAIEIINNYSDKLTD